MFYLALLPDKPELWNFQDSKVWVKVLAYGMFIIYVTIYVIYDTHLSKFQDFVKMVKEGCHEMSYLGP